jgi:protein gp37
MTGCTRISAGCDNCYAHTIAHTKTREVYLKQLPVVDTPQNQADPFAPRFWPERLDQPRRWKQPMRIFVNSMSDVFHAHFSLSQISAVFEAMHEASWHQFQVLTKRPERALRLADELPWAPNVWIGTSIENIAVAHRADAIRGITQAAVRFVSAEPLLGDLSDLDLQGIDWVIGGGESGPTYRPVQLNWAIALRDKCSEAGVHFLWKQWGGKTSKSGGRKLDGRLWDEYPLPHPSKRRLAHA